MNFEAKRQLAVQVAARYREGSHVQKSVMLDGFVAATGYAPKYAIRLLTNPAIPPPGPIRRLRHRHYGPEVQEALVVAWRAANTICSEGYESRKGSNGIRCPWPELKPPEYGEWTREGPKRTDVYRTWFLVDRVDRLEPGITIGGLARENGKRADPLGLRTAYQLRRLVSNGGVGDGVR